MMGFTEAAEYLGLSVSTMYVYNHRGDLPAPDLLLRCGPHWKPATLKRWSEKHGRGRFKK